MFGNNNPNPFMMGEQESFIDIDNNAGNIDIDINQDQAFMNGPVAAQSPVIEPMRERVVNRTIEHVVPHVCPIRTRVINHHIFKHTYQPNYTCCEENVCQHVQCGSCCNY